MFSLNTDESIHEEKRKHDCTRCGKETQQIPIRKIGSLFVIEHYCPFCDESIVRYEMIQGI